MLPTFKPNTFVICLKSSKIKVNDVVILNEKKLGKVLKRVKSISDNLITFKGDNKSYDSSIYENSYSISDVIGKVIFKI